jgi:carboxyl-terminal processing protease
MTTPTTWTRRSLSCESTSLSGEYQGIGAYVDTQGEFLTVVSPIEGSPAEAAGLRPGDMIIAIDGEDMADYTPEEARQRVSGRGGDNGRFDDPARG